MATVTTTTTTIANAVKRCIVYGGCGALGATIVSHLRSANYWICSIDMRVNDQANANILVKPELDLAGQEAHIAEKLTTLLANSASSSSALFKLDAILNVAGGWAGGNASKAETLLTSADLMWKQSVWSSLITGSLAAHHLTDDGVVCLPGAAPALGGTAGMIGYGCAKAAVHQLGKSLADVPASGLPSGACVATILPVTLDTPMNRKWMPDADQTAWTKLTFIAELMHEWIEHADKRPKENGSLVKLVTAANKTTLTFH